MKINEMPISYNRRAFVNDPAETHRAERERQKSDTSKSSTPVSLTVTLSDTSKYLLMAQKAVAESPDARLDKVAQLRQAIEAGTYEINPDQIAKKMIG